METEKQNVLIKRLFHQIALGKDVVEKEIEFLAGDVMQNTTIEERVSLLELQVANLDEDVDFLFQEQIIQDERLLNLETDTEEIDEQLIIVDDELQGLQATTLALDFRITVLQENIGNSSVAEIESQVETLVGTSADHESRISAAEANLTDLQESVADLEARQTVAEENIQGLEMTDVDLEARITALEENDTIAFHTILTSSPTLPFGSVVLFDEVLLNEGDGYDSTTGTFTVPSGGDGFYYFSAYLRLNGAQSATFDIRINGRLICTAFSDLTSSPAGDSEAASCTGVTYAIEGDEVEVEYRTGSNTTPVVGNPNYYYTGFTGLRID